MSTHPPTAERPERGQQPVDLRGADCFRLRKGLYGTKQAGRGWFYMLSKALIACGLKQAPEDPCLYFQARRVSTAVVRD